MERDFLCGEGMWGTERNKLSRVKKNYGTWVKPVCGVKIEYKAKEKRGIRVKFQVLCYTKKERERKVEIVGRGFE